mgnify:CR=1 FL=1
MNRILSIVIVALMSLPMFAAKVAAPVLKIDETGSLVVANRSGKTVYMYSITNQGTPSQPETVLPEEGVLQCGFSLLLFLFLRQPLRNRRYTFRIL